MVWGYPGSTDRYLSSWGVQQAVDLYNPTVVEIRDAKLAVMRKLHASGSSFEHFVGIELRANRQLLEVLHRSDRAVGQQPRAMTKRPISKPNSRLGKRRTLSVRPSMVRR